MFHSTAIVLPRLVSGLFYISLCCLMDKAFPSAPYLVYLFCVVSGRVCVSVHQQTALSVEVSGLQQPMQHPNVSVYASYFVMHLAMSVYKCMCCICTCALVPHPDVCVYKSLCRPCTGLSTCNNLCFTCRRICSTVVCAVPEGVCPIQAVCCTWMYEYLFYSSLDCARRCLAHSSHC
jgi:hypothetical protein